MYRYSIWIKLRMSTDSPECSHRPLQQFAYPWQFIPVIFHVFNSLEGYFNAFLWKDMDDTKITTGPRI